MIDSYKMAFYANLVFVINTDAKIGENPASCESLPEPTQECLGTQGDVPSENVGDVFTGRSIEIQ